MDKQKIGLVGALIIVAIALIGGIVLAAKGLPTPPWLTSLLTALGSLFAWFAKSPAAASEPKDGAP